MEYQKQEKLIKLDSNSHELLDNIDESHYANKHETYINSKGQTVHMYPIFGIRVTMLNLTDEEIKARLHQYKSSNTK